MTVLIEDQSLHNKEEVFANRNEGGHYLADNLQQYKGEKAIVLAIPSGGVPVGKIIQDKLGCDFDLLIVRKIQIPWNTEAGFGAINLDEDILINESLLYALQLSDTEISSQINKTKAMLQKRNDTFRHGNIFPSLNNRTVIIADDGLASGYTMRAAIMYVKKRKPAKVIMAVPTGLLKTIQQLLPDVDCIACMNIRETYPFAVASAYREWYDLSDDDVITLLSRT